MKKYIAILISLLLFLGCSTDESSEEDSVISGVLLDSNVSGVTYSCGGTLDITGIDGIFVCSSDSMINFKVGGVNLGSTLLSSSKKLQYITPAKLYGLQNNNITDKRVLNFIQFIQSLDEDGNAINGIQIDQTTRDKLQIWQSLDISNPSTTQDDINTTLVAIGKEMVPLDKALKHYIYTLYHTLNIGTNAEPYYYQQWYLDKNDTFYYQNYIDDDAHIHVGDLLATYTGKGVKIAVIDDGLDVHHEDLEGAIINTFDINTKTTDVSHSNSEEYHGTAVTGIIAARANNKGILGIASQSEIIFLKYKAVMSDSETIELFEKAKEFGADIINCSWGTYDVSQSVKEKIVDLAKNGRGGKGISIVFASGNDDQDMANDESAIPEVISVGSTDKDNLRAWYSNYGQNLDVMAPGGYNLGITTLDPMYAKGVASINENYLLYDDSMSFIGTSASAPIVSGVIALMLEKNPSLTRVEIEHILKNSSDKIGNLQYENGRNRYYGYGKINVAKILKN